MDNHVLSLIAVSYAIAGIGYLAYALHLFMRGRTWREGRPAGYMLLAVLLGAGWGGLGFAYALTGARLLVPLGLFADVLRYGAWSGFILSLIALSDTKTGNSPAKSQPLAPIAGLLLAVGVVVQAGLLLGIGDAASLARFASLQLLAQIVFSIVLLEQLFRNTAKDSQWSIKPLCLGLAGAFLYDLFLFSDTVLFSQFDSDAYGIRGFVHACIIPLLVVSTTRSKNWGAKMRLSQTLVFHSATLTMIGGYLLLMAAVGYYVRSFGGDWGRAMQLALLFLALLGLGVLVFSGSVRAKLRVLVGKHFFSYRYDYRDEWLRFTGTLSAQNSPAAMGEQVIRGLADLVESPSGVLWLKDAASQQFSQYSRWNMPDTAATERADSALCQFMLTSGWVVNLEEYRSFPRRYEGLELPGWLGGMPNAWLIVPLMTGGELIGFVILGSSRTTLDVNWEVNDLLRTAGRQAASYLAQMQATEALLEVRKFDAFNRMSAFVVHDLKNIVTQLSLMLRNAERHSEKPEFRLDMLMTVQHSVERMRQLMLQLREGATPPGTPVGVDLAEIIERIQAAKATQGRAISVELHERLLTRGHEERIERVIGHLIQNALDATDRGDAADKVWVSLARQGGQANVVVGDTGHGMSPDFLRERLFKPFQTTKQAGMGIGAYESFQYVQEIGGKIAVESEVGTGTRITVSLPLFETNPESALRAAPARETV